jgi:Fe-S cluster biosynthesis and repair protein YggX
MTDLTVYPQTDRFKVVDTVGVPHPYCITPKHLSTGRMVLDADAIREAEKLGAVCDICAKIARKAKDKSKILTYDQHEQALLVECKDIDMNNEEDRKLLSEYLLSIKDQAERDGMAGFAFSKG